MIEWSGESEIWVHEAPPSPKKVSLPLGAFLATSCLRQYLRTSPSPTRAARSSASLFMTTTALTFTCSRIASLASASASASELLLVSLTTAAGGAAGGGEGVSETFGEGSRDREGFLRVVGGACWLGLVILLGWGPKARVRWVVLGWADFRRPGGMVSGWMSAEDEGDWCWSMFGLRGMRIGDTRRWASIGRLIRIWHAVQLRVWLEEDWLAEEPGVARHSFNHAPNFLYLPWLVRDRWWKWRFRYFYSFVILSNSLDVKSFAKTSVNAILAREPFASFHIFHLQSPYFPFSIYLMCNSSSSLLSIYLV